jgi:nucleoside-diphosphate-sugar epimerase
VHGSRKLKRNFARFDMPFPPERFRRPRLLIVGCGDVGMRVLQLLRGPARWRMFVLTTHIERAAALRAAGASPLIGDLDHAHTVQRLAGLADAVLYLAPPPAVGTRDTRSQALIHALARQGAVQRVVYASTSGVYGDCSGECFDETRAVNPSSDRARRRVDAEARWRWFGRTSGARVTILRIPGIYAADRAGGHPRDRLARGTPVLLAGDDVYTNHIHADDLARVCVAALARGLPQRVVHASDDSEMKMGDYFDLAADLCAVPRPPRISREQMAVHLSPMQASFMGESRRLRNKRLKKELRVALHYPTVHSGLVG